MDEKSEFLHVIEKAVDFWCKKQQKKKKHRIKTTFKAEMRKSWTQHEKEMEEDRVVEAPLLLLGQNTWVGHSFLC